MAGRGHRPHAGRAASRAWLPAAGFRRVRGAVRTRVPGLPVGGEGLAIANGGGARGRMPGDGRAGRCRRSTPGRLFRWHAPARRHRPGPAQRPEAADRRRTHGRPGSGGTGALPPPAGGTGRRTPGDPVDAHRVRHRSQRRHPGDHEWRAAALPRHAGSADGPGRSHVWQWTLPAEQLAEARATLRISRAQRRAHGVEVRVVGDEAPAPDAIQVAPDLEDAYLWLLHRSGAQS